jgi:hypothetical protein
MAKMIKNASMYPKTYAALPNKGDMARKKARTKPETTDQYVTQAKDARMGRKR